MNKKWIDKIYRFRGQLNTRFNYLRLDKNERTSKPISDRRNVLRSRRSAVTAAAAASVQHRVLRTPG